MSTDNIDPLGFEPRLVEIGASTRIRLIAWWYCRQRLLYLIEQLGQSCEQQCRNLQVDLRWYDRKIASVQESALPLDVRELGNIPKLPLDDPEAAWKIILEICDPDATREG